MSGLANPIGNTIRMLPNPPSNYPTDEQISTLQSEIIMDLSNDWTELYKISVRKSLWTFAAESTLGINMMNAISDMQQNRKENYTPMWFSSKNALAEHVQGCS